MADEFSFDREQRDHLLGAQLSLAYSVYSIPGAMILGLLADLGSRKNLFVCVVALGAFATLCTAYVEKYNSLFYLRILRCVCVYVCMCECVSVKMEIYMKVGERKRESMGKDALDTHTYLHTHTHTHTHITNSGIATNAVIPIAFSFLGDLYPAEGRNLPSTLVTAAMGVGILVGQILAGA